FPSPVQNNHMADLVLAAAPGYSFEGATQGEPVADVTPGSTPGAHGYLSADPDMNAIFIASGAGIKPGAKLGLIRNLDVAPTIAPARARHDQERRTGSDRLNVARAPGGRATSVASPSSACSHD